MWHTLSFFHKAFAVGWKGIGTEPVHVVLAGTEVAMYRQKYEQVYHIFHLVFVHNKLSVAYVNGASYIQKILEFHICNKSALSEALSRCSPFELQLYFHGLAFLQDVI